MNCFNTTGNFYWRYKFSNAFPRAFCNYFEDKIAYFSKGVWRSAASSPSGVQGPAVKAKAFLGFTYS